MQAYAELESDTPGTVFGITKKTDGKSFRSFTSKNTNKTTEPQGEKDESYEKNAQTDQESRDEIESEQKWWKILGGVIVIVIAFQLAYGSGDETSNIIADQFANEHGIRTQTENRTIFKDA